MQQKNDAVQLVEFIVKNLVDKPSKVIVTSSITGDNTLAIAIQVHPDDRGKVIGRKGRIITAIREITNSLAGKEQRKITVEI